MCSTMLLIRFAGIAALSDLSMAASYSWLNCFKDVKRQGLAIRVFKLNLCRFVPDTT